MLTVGAGVGWHDRFVQSSTKVQEVEIEQRTDQLSYRRRKVILHRTNASSTDQQDGERTKLYVTRRDSRKRRGKG